MNSATHDSLFRFGSRVVSFARPSVKRFKIMLVASYLCLLSSGVGRANAPSSTAVRRDGPLETVVAGGCAWPHAGRESVCVLPSVGLTGRLVFDYSRWLSSLRP